MDRLADKVALVTGAGSGIGKAVAEIFVAEKATVFVADINRAAGEAVADSLGKMAEFVPLDVSQESSWKSCIDTIREKTGRLDVLVNSAGILVFDNIETGSVEQWEQVQKVNGTGVYLACKHGISLMKDTTRSGAIINLSSAGSLRSSSENLTYCASKALVDNVTRTVALHCALQRYPITCNSVHPSVVDTPMMRGDREGEEGEKFVQGFAGLNPVGRISQVDDIVGSILFLASDESRFVTGSRLIVDGGYTIA